MKTIFLVCWIPALMWSVSTTLYSQTPTQNIRGVVLDKDSQAPLIGATVAVLTTDPLIGATTDVDGNFQLDKVPVGRHSVSVSYVGYEPLALNSILVNAGKELVLTLELTESTIAIDEVVVTARTDKDKPLNEFASVSARSFSVEETSRYAAAAFDPARMAQNFAGVSVGSGDDLFNEIVIRGNSPRGIMWRLEGIEIPNPNHFSGAGSSGGAISMLSSTTLAGSDFYTGAFPAEFGNAVAGVFDLNLRNGNNQQQEYSLMFGLLGLELGLEGPFSKNGRSSYLVNYRYSTLKAMEAIGLSPVGDILPKYQDISFKFNFPTNKAGTFALFGLGGNNASVYDPDPNPATWENDDDDWGFSEEQEMGLLGLSHKIITSPNSYLRTVLAGSINDSRSSYYYIDTIGTPRQHDDAADLVSDQSLRLSTTYSHKINARHTLRAGAIVSALSFKFQYDEDDGEQLQRYFDNRGSMYFLQSFLQWKHRLNEQWTLQGGLHYSHMGLNGESALEPRVALQYQYSPTQSFSASLGLHSNLEHMAVYLFDGSFPDGTRHSPGRHLGLTKALHAVVGYDQKLGTHMRLKIEAYFQHLYNIPIEADQESTASLVNAANIWDVIGAEDAVADGIARNYGLDLTLERFFHAGYYFLMTGSLYDSRYQTHGNTWQNTKYNGQYQLSLLGGKEFRIGKKNIFGLNAKVVFSGGNRYTPIDLEASRLKGEAVYLTDQAYSLRSGDYRRVDVGFSYRINTLGMTHSLLLDIQNVFNRQNLYTRYFNEDTGNLEDYFQTGFFPILNYRLEF